jgi:hypothetical protein
MGTRWGGEEALSTAAPDCVCVTSKKHSKGSPDVRTCGARVLMGES